MNHTRMVVWHLNRDLAIVAGLASQDVHMYPYTDAVAGFSTRFAEAVQALWDAHCYVPVAYKVFEKAMTAEQLERQMDWMFEKTNNVESAWASNAEQNLLGLPSGRTPHRSTSVGDIIQVNDNHTIRLFRIASVGFEAMGEWKRA